jgi:hypothetical protein
MFTASFYFLGLAGSILAAAFFLTKGWRAGRCVEVDLDTLRAVSICLPTDRSAALEGTFSKIYKELMWDKKVKWTNLKAMWQRWYALCREKAIQKQKAMYSWSRTMALCSVLCLIGVLLEAEFDQPITMRTVLTGFRHPEPAAASFHKS